MVRLLAPTGMVGTGFSQDSFERALELSPDVIGCDAGSADPGPYYLGSGQSLPSRAATGRDLCLMLRAAVERGIPLLVGPPERAVPMWASSGRPSWSMTSLEARVCGSRTCSAASSTHRSWS